MAVDGLGNVYKLKDVTAANPKGTGMEKVDYGVKV
jgi:hypothetical protein